MNDFVLVLNAGSSSLKFCVYRADDTAIDIKGQIDGIGTKARYTAKSADGAKEYALTEVKDAAGALQSLTGAFRERYGGRATVLAVGHRVVHGGATHTQPARLTPRVLDE